VRCARHAPLGFVVARRSRGRSAVLEAGSRLVDAFFAGVVHFKPFCNLTFVSPGVGYLAKRTTGVVRWFDGSKGYGYINAEDGEEVFVHHTAITGQGSPLLSQGERVVFFLERTVRGAQATDVTRLN
jgi:CspA family cold shock protein